MCPRQRIVAAGAFLLVCSGAVYGHLIVFKDGFILQGEVKQNQEIVADRNGAVMVPKGPFYLDDQARRFTFSRLQLQDVQKKDRQESEDVLYGLPRVRSLGNQFLPFIEGPATAGPWGPKWDRSFTIPDKPRALTVRERLMILTPRYARVGAVGYNWGSSYLTSELGPQAVRKLLYDHPDVKLKGDGGDLAKRLRVFRFLGAAGFYEDAGRELDAVEKDYPDEKAKINDSRQALRELEASRLLEEIERAFRAGRHEWAQKRLGEFPKDAAGATVVAAVRSLEAKYEAANEARDQAVRFLKELPPAVAEPVEQAFFTEAAAAIREELCLDDFFPEAGRRDAGRGAGGPRVQRLDSFVNLARQAERDRRQKRQPSLGPAQLLSLAVTGWLQGPEAAEPKVETARKLWQARAFVLKYQQTSRKGAREQLLSDYQAQKTQALAFDEVAQLVGLLPPPEPEKAASAGPMELETNLAAALGREASYVVQLPAEFRPARPYPVLLALHGAGERPREMLARLGAAGGEYGYIVAAPEWAVAGEAAYSYSAREHAAVLDTLRDLRRRFPVDGDRVFLLGYGEGAGAAFDVGLSHPDLFAGILPVSGDPQAFCRSYWRNAQYLPFYVVNGGWAGVAAQHNNWIFNQWIPRGYPALHVEYKGRGPEWFAAEVPTMLDWMGRKSRAHAIPELGRDGNGGGLGDEFQTLRPTDNHFYWLSTDALNPRNAAGPQGWNGTVSAANLDARILEGNQININVRGLKQLTVWFGLDMRGRIDFDQPLTVRLNGGVSWNKRRVTPSLQTMMEDFYQRGDRQRLVLARMDFDL